MEREENGGRGADISNFQTISLQPKQSEGITLQILLLAIY